MERKIIALADKLIEMKRVIIAFSGGVDSSLLLKIAYDTLGGNAMAITAMSPSVPQEELIEAKEIASSIGVKHVIIDSQEINDPRYLENSPDRCYFCRYITFDDIDAYAQEHGYFFILDGNNADDLDDYRPGRKAAKELGIQSPLQEVGLTKSEIRLFARKLHLPNWNKPSAACLSSRIPYGTRISIEILNKVEQAESLLRELGFDQVRVRHHDQVARIEVPPQDLIRAINQREFLNNKFKEIGYHYVTLDLAGFRSGSMNEVL